MRKYERKKGYVEEPEFKITKNENDWKFEFSLKYKGFKFIRGKVYDKTAEKDSSCGVSLNRT